MRLRMLAVGDTLAGESVRSSVLFHFVGADRVDPSRVSPKIFARSAGVISA